MKTKAWALGAMLATGVGGFGIAHAQNQSAQPQQTNQNAQTQQTQTDWVAEGRVIKVDDDELKISRPGGPNIEFELTRDTTFRMSGGNASQRDLQPGAEVRVRFDLSEDDTLAREVDIVRQASTPTKR